MAASRGPVIRLHGPGDEHDRWVYFEEDFLDCIRAAQLVDGVARSVKLLGR
ncbi:MULTISPECIES: hypothetical protein [unclassified Kribbella]|uniref:hypothetical protein n=1 Tax=unclassified Kribbella TaxID=2644121 RepID=UPI003077FD92